MAESTRYFYGPVLSRRLGRSYGVDIVPLKVCSLDCVYCQLGSVSRPTLKRKPYVPATELLREFDRCTPPDLQADFVTISGSGEPTLNSDLGAIVKGIKQAVDIPVAVLTNGTLFYLDDVRAACAQADLVLPSLDAGDEQTFRKMNRPHADLSIESHIDGLCRFRQEYAGPIWLEVFLVEGLNTGPTEIQAIKEAVERIRPDKVQLNTAARPTAEPGLRGPSASRLEEIAALLGPSCEVIGRPGAGQHIVGGEMKAEDLLSMLKRRPCTLEEICRTLNMTANEVLKHVGRLTEQGLVETLERDGARYFAARRQK